MKAAIIAGCVVLLVLAAPRAHAATLEEYRKPVCKTADDYAGCMANKKPQMWATDGIRWDCRHGFDLVEDGSGPVGNIDDDKVEFITTSLKRRPTRLAKHIANAPAERQSKSTVTKTTSAGADF